MDKLTASSRASSLRQRKGESMRLESNGEIIQTKETKEEFIFDVRKLLDANENIADVNLEQIVDMVHELAESYRY
jgi:hypothetical protein